MNCEKCNGPNTHVIDSRSSNDGKSIRRRRKCADCDHRFNTYEHPESYKHEDYNQQLEEENRKLKRAVAVLKDLI